MFERRRRPGEPEDSTTSTGSSSLRLRLSRESAALLGSLTLDSFALNSSQITSAQQDRLNRYVEALRLVREQHPGALMLTGHTDATGSEQHNEGLGLRRAQSVKIALMLAGIPGEIMFTQSAGETALLIPTQAEEPMNRRVEISYMVGQSSMPSPGTPPTVSVTDLLRPRFGLPPPPLPDNLLPGPRREPQLDLPPWFWNPNFPGPPQRPATSFNRAVYGAVDQALSPILNGLGIRGWLRERIISGAHDLVDKGVESVLDSALDAAHIQGEEREAIQGTVRALRQQPIR